jgi:hypothetical protein
LPFYVEFLNRRNRAEERKIHDLVTMDESTRQKHLKRLEVLRNRAEAQTRVTSLDRPLTGDESSGDGYTVLDADDHGDRDDGRPLNTFFDIRKLSDGERATLLKKVDPVTAKILLIGCDYDALSAALGVERRAARLRFYDAEAKARLLMAQPALEKRRDRPWVQVETLKLLDRTDPHRLKNMLIRLVPYQSQAVVRYYGFLGHEAESLGAIAGTFGRREDVMSATVSNGRAMLRKLFALTAEKLKAKDPDLLSAFWLLPEESKVTLLAGLPDDVPTWVRKASQGFSQTEMSRAAGMGEQRLGYAVRNVLRERRTRILGGLEAMCTELKSRQSPPPTDPDA